MASQASFPRKKICLALGAALLLPIVALAATDPGVRGGGAGAGTPFANLTANETAAFNAGSDQFAQVDAVADGLGPRFNLDSCGGCHAQPAMGGSAPAVNPQIAVATKNGARNPIPSFISANGPVREARFVKDANGNADGGVHDLFTIANRADAPGCNLQPDNFAQAVSNNNVIFRIPTPTFGAGLMEIISDNDIVDNAARSASSTLGISGRVNRSGNDGSVTRFGWKAQNKSLLIFSGEAYNVEMGVTNVLFPNTRDVPTAFFQGCNFNASPESAVNFDAAAPDNLDDASLFTIFMQFLSPPTPSSTTPGGSNSIVQGQNQFVNIGCANCHTLSFTTQTSPVAALSQQPVNLLSDLALHNMGPGLADRVSQGAAGGDEFRTAPLWGVGQRIFFLHDGRTTDIVQAIQAHKSAANTQFPASEANTVINKFNALSASDQQAIVNFLRSR